MSSKSATQVYCIRTPGIDGEPWIDTQLAENASIPWSTIGEVLRGTIAATNYEPIHLTVFEEGWENWHYYPIAGMGLFSETLISLIGTYMQQYFDLSLKAFVNDFPFRLARAKDSLNCLDAENSKITYFPRPPRRVMLIERYSFFKDKISDPLVFLIPETRTDIFATQSIKQMVIGAKLKGMVFLDAEKLK